MLMLLLSLAINTPPAELEIHLVDLKNEDLVPLQALPHVRSLAVTPWTDSTPRAMCRATSAVAPWRE
jgi:hypothetical protein